MSAVHNSVEVRLSFRSHEKAVRFFARSSGSGFMFRNGRTDRTEVHKTIENDILAASYLGEEAFKVMRAKTDAEVSIEFYTVKTSVPLIGSST